MTMIKAVLGDITKQGDVEAMYRLGECYADLYGVRNNDRKAFLWFKRAANRGHEEAMWNVGLFYQRGIGVKKNLDLAAEWYDKAGLHDKAKRLRNGEDDYAVDEDGFCVNPLVAPEQQNPPF